MRYLEAAPDIKSLLDIIPVKCSDEEKASVLEFIDDPDQFRTDTGDNNPMDDDGESFGCTHNDLKLIGGTWTEVDVNSEMVWRYLGARVLTEGERGLLIQGEGSPYRGNVDYIEGQALPIARSFPTINLSAQDYLANTGFDDNVQEVAIPRVPGDTRVRENDWINISRVGGAEVNTMDGFTGISQQVIRVTSLSANRTNVSFMANYVHDRINNLTGQQRKLDGTMTLDFQCCLLDEEFDQNNEEETIYGKDQFYLVVVSP